MYPQYDPRRSQFWFTLAINLIFALGLAYYFGGKPL